MRRLKQLEDESVLQHLLLLPIEIGRLADPGLAAKICYRHAISALFENERLLLGRRSYRPILPAFAIIAERGGLHGRKAMEWFKQKTSIAGVQVSNWMIVLGAIIIILLIVQNSH
jgi:hypothetical protein